jgi:hypothetical protein
MAAADDDDVEVHGGDLARKAQGKYCFFEKKQQKTFALLGRRLWRGQRPWPSIQKFLRAFFKKRCFTY